MLTCLTIAGSDCCAGAGIQTDLKAFHAHDCYGLSAITAIVSEVPSLVDAVEPVSDATLSSQIRLLLEHYPVAAIKTGMLYSASKVEVVANELDRAQFKGQLVIDPVLVATSGDSLATPDLVKALHQFLLPRASLITPNLDEIQTLTGEQAGTLAELESAASTLAKGHQCAVLAKGGHLKSDNQITDVLVEASGSIHRFQQKRVPVTSSHGTGCTLAATIAAKLAHGATLPSACREAQQFIAQALTHSHQWNKVQAMRVI